MRPAALQRVLLVSPGAFASNGGIQAYNRSLLRALHELLTARGGRCEVLLLEDADGQLDLRYLAPEQPRPRGFSGRRALFALAVLSRILRWAPDLVIFAHVHFATLGLAARILRPGTIQWFIAYGIDAWEPLRGSRRHGLAGAEAVVSISDDTRRRMARANRLPPERLLLLPCSLDPFWHVARPRQQEASDPTAPVLLSVSRLDANDGYKGVDRMIEALPALVPCFPGLRYEIVGDGSDRPRLETLARTLGVSGHVLFLGRLPGAELAQAYARATLFALPSTGEGFGIVYLEAAAFAKPSLAAREGGSAEVVEDGVTGRLVSRGEGSALASALEELLSRPDELERFGSRARQRLEERFLYPTFRDNLARILGLGVVPRIVTT